MRQSCYRYPSRDAKLPETAVTEPHEQAETVRHRGYAGTEDAESRHTTEHSKRKTPPTSHPTQRETAADTRETEKPRKGRQGEQTDTEAQRQRQRQKAPKAQEGTMRQTHRDDTGDAKRHAQHTEAVRPSDTHMRSDPRPRRHQPGRQRSQGATHDRGRQRSRFPPAPPPLPRPPGADAACQGSPRERAPGRQLPR